MKQEGEERKKSKCSAALFGLSEDHVSFFTVQIVVVMQESLFLPAPGACFRACASNT